MVRYFIMITFMPQLNTAIASQSGGSFDAKAIAIAVSGLLPSWHDVTSI
jgi:hypothetical protein